MYPIDELANIVPMASELDQIALTNDIKKNGQREPAVLWQGKIVDGRCRQLACHTLDIELQTRELDSKLSREEVQLVVKSLNTRRNLTEMQKAMSACKAQTAEWRTNEEMAAAWGIPLGTYKNARYIANNRPDLVEPLFHGKSVDILDPDKGYNITTNKINTLARIIKKTKEKDNILVDDSEKIEFKVDGLIKTEAGKQAVYSIVRSSDITDPSVIAVLIEWANMKYKLKESDEDNN